MIAPPPELQDDFYYVERPNSNRQEAIYKEALLKHVEVLEDEAEDRELQSHSKIMHHSHIVNTCCDTITRIREKHDVDILFRYKESVKHVHDIVIVGAEHQAHAAKEELLDIMQELRISMVQAKLFGFREKVIAKVNCYFNEMVCFPLDKKTNKITITGMTRGVKYTIIWYTSRPSSLKASPYAGRFVHGGCPRVRIEPVPKL